MGAGNFLPAQEIGDHEMVYVEPESEDEDDYRWMIQNIRDFLPGSFYNVDEWRGRNSRAIARNAQLDVCVADNQYTTAVFIVPTEGLVEYPKELNLAYHNMGSVAKRLFGKLKDYGYKLSVRCGPWTSGQYQ